LLSIYLPLLLIRLLLLLVFLHFMSLQLVADQRARSQAKQTANRRAGSRVSHGTADDATSGSAPECSDSRSLFARSQRGGAGRESGCEKYQSDRY
jgi:hypothetical protein